MAAADYGLGVTIRSRPKVRFMDQVIEAGLDFDVR